MKQRNTAAKTAGPADLGIPDLLVPLGEFDPEDEIAEPGRRFLATWKDIYGDTGGVELKWIAGHDHNSPPLALMSGDMAGQEWG